MTLVLTEVFGEIGIVSINKLKKCHEKKVRWCGELGKVGVITEKSRADKSFPNHSINMSQIIKGNRLFYSPGAGGIPI